ncbi:MAG: hypothetical protein IJ600_08495 [Lachnospiraceae bacterium]|nr:hypothetical protein [Lachnospiraceae bacterium]
MPDEYRYFQYHDRVIRSYTYTYELINPDTGEWEACNTNYDFEMDWDCDPIGFSEAAALIEKEQQAGEKRLFEELDIAFQQYEKPLAGQFPVFQDWLTGAGEPVALADTRDGEYYIADPYGLLITIEDSSILQEKYIFCYNIDKRGIRFWDSEPDAFLRHDLVTGQIRLFRLQKEWLRDLWPDLVEHRYRVPAQWFHFFKKRASKEEGEWLMEVVEAAIQECMDDGTRNANVPRQAAEKSFSEKLTMAAQKVRESAHSDLGEVYSMMEFRTQQAALPECLMLGILKNVIQSRAFKGDYYLIRFPESGITTEDMLEAGRRLRQRISEMKRFYPETEIKIIMAEPDKKVSEKYAIHNYYRDLEDGGLWDRTYRTTPGYSREDGWWYKKPVKIG